MRVVIVEPCAVDEDVIAFNFYKREFFLLIAFPIAFFLFLLIRVIGECLCPKAAFISKRVFTAIVPIQVESPLGDNFLSTQLTV